MDNASPKSLNWTNLNWTTRQNVLTGHLKRLEVTKISGPVSEFVPTNELLKGRIVLIKKEIRQYYL